MIALPPQQQDDWVGFAASVRRGFARQPRHRAPAGSARVDRRIGRHGEDRIRLGWINRAVNMAIRATSDWAQYGYADFWASPLQTLGSGAGDWEDYAIVKYVALRELGVLPDDLRLVIVQDEKRETRSCCRGRSA